MASSFGGGNFPRRVDANQPAVVEALRAHGFCVEITSAAGAGFPDLQVSCWVEGRGPFAVGIEIKDGAKKPHQRKLTPAQLGFFRRWLGPLAIVYSPQEAVWLMREIRAGNLAALEAAPFRARLPDERRGAFGKAPEIEYPGDEPGDN